MEGKAERRAGEGKEAQGYMTPGPEWDSAQFRGVLQEEQQRRLDPLWPPDVLTVHLTSVPHRPQEPIACVLAMKSRQQAQLTVPPPRINST